MNSYLSIYLIYIYIYIENADATPPHLKVFPAVGELSGFAGFVQIFAVNSSEFVFIMQGLLHVVVLIIFILLTPQSQTKIQYQNYQRTLS